MTSAALSLSHAPTTAAPMSDDENLDLVGVANALIACYTRGADRETMLTMCERLHALAETELLERERKMMISGDPELATHVRRHGDMLLVLSRQVRDSRRTSTPPARTFINFVSMMVERFRT